LIGETTKKPAKKKVKKEEKEEEKGAAPKVFFTYRSRWEQDRYAAHSYFPSPPTLLSSFLLLFPILIEFSDIMPD
jgi:hypothetical protein